MAVKGIMFDRSPLRVGKSNVVVIINPKVNDCDSLQEGSGFLCDVSTVQKQ